MSVEALINVKKRRGYIVKQLSNIEDSSFIRVIGGLIDLKETHFLSKTTYKVEDNRESKVKQKMIWVKENHEVDGSVTGGVFHMF